MARSSIKISEALQIELKDATDRLWLEKRIRVSQAELLERAWQQFAVSPKLVTPTAVPPGDVPAQVSGLSSNNLSQLRRLASLLGEAARLLDEVLTDGEDSADPIGKLEAELDAINAPCCDVGADRKDPPQHGVTGKKGRRAR